MPDAPKARKWPKRERRQKKAPPGSGLSTSRFFVPWSAIRHEFVTTEGLSTRDLTERWNGRTWRGKVVNVSLARVAKRCELEGWVGMRAAHFAAASSLALEQSAKRLADIAGRELEGLMLRLSRARDKVLDALEASIATPMSDEERHLEETENVDPRPVVGPDGAPAVSSAKMVTKRVKQGRAPVNTELARDVVRCSVELVTALARLDVGRDAGQDRAVIE